MKLSELYLLLRRVGLPVTYSHFEKGQVPPLPYICYLEISTDNFKADGKVYQKVTDVDIELYTKKKELDIEDSLEQILNENGIPWDSDEIYINDEKVFKKTYEVRLIQ